MARSPPQATFTAFQQIYQHEWQYLQCVVLDVAEHFAPIETAICTAFFPDLLGGTTPTTIPPDLRSLLFLPVKSAGVSVPNPSDSTNDYRTTSSMCTAVLTNSLLDGNPLTITDHQKEMRDGRSAAQASKCTNVAAKLSTPHRADDSFRHPPNHLLE